MANADHNIGWDGTIYHQDTGTYETVPEGNYTIRLQAALRDGGQWQTVTMPVTVDFTPPKISKYRITRSGNNLSIRFLPEDHDDLSPNIAIALNGYTTEQTLVRAVYDPETGYYTGDYRLRSLDRQTTNRSIPRLWYQITPEIPQSPIIPSIPMTMHRYMASRTCLWRK